MQEGKAKMWKLGKITAKTHIGDYGQIVDSFFVLLLKDTCWRRSKDDKRDRFHFRKKIVMTLPVK